MVNIRATLDKAVTEGILDGSLTARLTEIGKALFYKERSWDAILRLATHGGLSPVLLDRLAGWLRGRSVDQKRMDALSMITALSGELSAGVKQLTISYQFRATGYHKAAARQRTHSKSTVSSI